MSAGMILNARLRAKLLKLELASKLLDMSNPLITKKAPTARKPRVACPPERKKIGSFAFTPSTMGYEWETRTSAAAISRIVSNPFSLLPPDLSFSPSVKTHLLSSPSPVSQAHPLDS